MTTYPRALPPFPVDDGTLDLLQAAIDNPGGPHSNLHGALAFLSGDYDSHSHTDRCLEPGDSGAWICADTRPTYHVNDTVTALITEIRRLRAAAP